MKVIHSLYQLFISKAWDRDKVLDKPKNRRREWKGFNVSFQLNIGLRF